MKKARDRILALDYDGTLAPFQVDRMAARPLAGIPEVMASILERGGTRVAVISGRPLDELAELMGRLFDRVTAVGAHGWQWKDPGGPIEELEPGPAVKARLERAAQAARRAGREILPAESGPDSRIEVKTASVAAHTRGLDPERARRWLDLVRKEWTAASEGLELLGFDGGLELRDPARDKGRAVRELGKRHPDHDLMVYLGDDRTDEDAFLALDSRGAGIKVGGQDAPSAARYRLRDCEAVREFLVRWNQIIVAPKGEDGP